MLSPTFSMKCIWTTSILCLEYASPALLLIFLTTEIWFRIQNLGQFLPFSGNFVFSKYYHIPCTLCGRLHFPKMTVTVSNTICILCLDIAVGVPHQGAGSNSPCPWTWTGPVTALTTSPRQKWCIIPMDTTLSGLEIQLLPSSSGRIKPPGKL